MKKNTQRSKAAQPIMIDRNELMARWGISMPTIKRMDKRGDLTPVYLSTRIVRYRIEDIEKIEADAYGKERG